ncbi:ral guanine nucleotide dissociation stimulator-like [Equus caballus]|uniref:ral guanine nucleotide dissociation stimulator-like n=1 Tax=Equus caballus TaxID=9796 RepID=UPI0038B2592A
MEQGVIPSLEMIFSYLELLHDETDYYVEGNVLSCRNEVRSCGLTVEFKFIKDIEMVQKAANLYTVQPDEHFGAWFQAVEPLSEEARAAPPTLPRGSARTGRTLGAGAGPPCSVSWAQRRLWTEHAHQRPPRRLRARARALTSRSWRRDLRSGRAPGGSRAAVPTRLPRFGGLSDEPRRPEMFRLERHFPEGSGHSRSSASIPCSRGSPSLQALDSLCSFPVEESQGGLISFGDR